jgi:hypothetical protein
MGKTRAQRRVCTINSSIKTVFIAGLLLWVSVFAITGSLCWFQAVVGIPCPGCGSIRATMALFRGDFAEAFYWHPLILLSLFLLAYATFRSIFFRKKNLHKMETYMLVSVTLIYVVVFAVRMYLLFPNHEPLLPLDTALWRQGFVFFRRIFS